MKVFRTIMLFLLGKMNQEKRDMPSCGIYEKNGKGFKMEQAGSERSTVFLYSSEKRGRIGLLFANMY